MTQFNDGVVKDRDLNTIAREIARDWTKPYFGAVPYLTAMRSLAHLGEMYYEDTAQSVVLYFLANANTWKGETARRIKKELRDMIAAYRTARVEL
jgi:ATP-dependent Zn protease